MKLLHLFCLLSALSGHVCSAALKVLKPKVSFVTMTQDAEKMIAYIARVSNPANQDNPNFAKLLKYCIDHGHWSVFEQASFTLEVESSRAVIRQILRHRSFTFQEFSQRYASVNALQEELSLPDLRLQDTKNRQNSIDALTDEQKAMWHEKIAEMYAQTAALYKEMLDAGIAKESARFILPESTKSRVYVTGSVRSWIHYIQLRQSNGTQKEHQEVALLCKAEFKEKFPIISEALGWDKE